MNLYVVFTGKTDLRWLKVLKPGFRHCFAIINDGYHWVSVDPMAHATDILVHHVPAGFDFPLYLRRRGFRVVKAAVQRIKRQAPPGIFTCVEAVKRIAGIQARHIITPWQLYRYLKTTKGDPSWAA